MFSLLMLEYLRGEIGQSRFYYLSMKTTSGYRVASTGAGLPSAIAGGPEGLEVLRQLLSHRP